MSNAVSIGKRVALKPAPPSYKDNNSYKITVEVTGVSQCPYYQMFFEVLYKPFLEQYPALSKLVKYVYVSLMSPSDALATRGNTMHGMHEALQDLYKACMQDIASQDDFLRYESCLVDHQG